MNAGRIATFSDGVFAFAFTLLVLDFTVPLTHFTNASLAHDLFNEWPALVAYSISFLLIGLIWVNYHGMLRQIAVVDRMLVFLNVLLLANIAFLPFPTAVLAQALRNGDGLMVAAMFYGLALTIGGLFFNGMWLYATQRKFHKQLSAKLLHRTRVYFLVGPTSYAVATGLAFASPYLAILAYVGLIIFYWLPLAEKRDPADT